MRVKRRPRFRLRLALALVAVLAVLGGAWLWVRDSSLVAVQKVTISGVSGPDAGRIRSALTLAARNMTTLDVRIGSLRTAVAAYPMVNDLSVSADFPHSLRIHVAEQLPVGALAAGGREIAASGDGTLLHDVPTASLPVVPVGLLPGGARVLERPALQALALLAAAPRRLRARIDRVMTSPSHGLVADLRAGPSLYFGDDSDLPAKWLAATEVLADASSAGATYIDVTDPARPAAGASEQAVAAAGLASTGSQTSATGSQATSSTSQASTTGG
jgi:cell division protein FtsQ